MKKSENHEIIKLAIYCFKYSLIIGTIFFLSFLVTGNTAIALFGLFYLCLATAVNLFALLLLLITLITIPENRTAILKTMGLVVLNLPIAYFYLWVIATFPTL